MSDFAVMPITEYVDICDTIREKTGESSVIKSGEMPEKIGKVYEAGQKSEYDRIWDNMQVNGKRTVYYGFWQNTSTDDFYPKYDIKPLSAREMMRDMTGNPLDLAERLNECGVKLDMSNCTDVTYAFYSGSSKSAFTRLPELDLRQSGSSQQYGLFSSAVVTIDKFYPSATGRLSSTFTLATGLENIVIGSEITQSGMRLENCTKLTHDSLMSFINALADYSADTSGTAYKLTLGATNLAKLTDEEKMIMTNKGWQYS